MTTQMQDTKEVSKFGNGRYSPLMSECYDDLLAVFGLSPEKAEHVAKAIGSEIGALMRNQPVAVRVSEQNKDGKITLAEACKLKNVSITNTIMVLRALQWANGAVKNGFNRSETKWVAIPALQEYFDSI